MRETVSYFNIKETDGIPTATYLVKGCNSLARFNKAINGTDLLTFEEMIEAPPTKRRRGAEPSTADK